MPVVPACLPFHSQNQNSALNQEMNLRKPPRYPPPPPSGERHSSTGKTFVSNPRPLPAGAQHTPLTMLYNSHSVGTFFLTLRRYVTQPSVPFAAGLQQGVLTIDFPTLYSFQQALWGDCYELCGICLPLKANLLV